jgi:hypothetical protein
MSADEILVTVSHRVDPRHVEIARERAAVWGLRFFERSRYSGLPDATYLVLGSNGWTLRKGESALRFSEGLARLRIKRLMAGERDDALVKWGELTAGDEVLDCTFGLGADAQVAAYVAGPTGQVTGLESSLPLWVLADEGLKLAPDFPRAPMRVIRTDALTFLKEQRPRAFNCVLLDPMFSRTKKASPAFELMRLFADHSTLSVEAVELARRVARRWVLVKGARYSNDLKRLGLTPLASSRFSEVIWARVAVS